MSDVPTGLRKHKIKHKRGQPLKEKREKEKEGSTLESEILIMRIQPHRSTPPSRGG